MTINNDQLEKEKETENRAWKYVLWLVVATTLFLVLDPKHQDLWKMSLWTIIFLGLIFTHGWPFLVDALSRSIIAIMALLHFAILWTTYPNIPHHNFIAIGCVIAGEYVLSLLPLAWLDVRSQKQRSLSQITSA